MGKHSRLRVYVIERQGRGFVFRWKDHDGQAREQRSDARTRRSAERAARALEDSLSAAGHGEPGDCTWGVFKDRYHDDYLDRTSRGNRDKWAAVCKHFAAFLEKRGLDNPALDAVTVKLVSAFESYLRKTLGSEASVHSYMRTFRAGLSWAAGEELMAPLPLPRKRRDSPELPTMSGRPITGEEYERMLASVKKVLPQKQRQGFTELLQAYWLGGLRRAEPLDFHWTDFNFHRPMGLDTDSPKVAFSCSQKSRKTQVVAIVPEFAAFLRSIRRDDGWVFNPIGKSGERLRSGQSLGRIVREIAKHANVAIRTGDEPVYATAQNLRQSFGYRWCIRVSEATLQHLMRHADLKTTRTYYAVGDADLASRDIRHAEGKIRSIEADEAASEIRSL